MKVLLVVSGGIAAYKACELARELGRRGHTVRVVLTASATNFVQPLTFEALTGEPAFADMWAPREGAMEHIDLARWAEVVVCAPATANLLARMAHGLADELATTCLMAWDGPLLVAPAMNPTMWAHPATRENVATLEGRGVVFVGPAEGDTACGEVGAGRLAEPIEIAEAVDRLRAPPERDLEGVRVMISAGPTREHLDPARFLSNPSTGKMGFRIASAARRRGAVVTLLLGPTAHAPPEVDELVRITSAADLHREVMARLPEQDVYVSAAAVADWTPSEPSEEKRKKVEGPWSLELVRTRDVLLTAAEARREGQVLVGFAAETSAVIQRGAEKLEKKDLDLLVANRIGSARTGFGGEENEAAVLVRGRPPPGALERIGKQELAEALLDALVETMKDPSRTR